jgi:hypothetical protein
MLYARRSPPAGAMAKEGHARRHKLNDPAEKNITRDPSSHFVR